MTDQEKLEAILLHLRQAHVRAATAESRALDELNSAKGAHERAERRERYEYVVGKFMGLGEAIDIVDRII